EIYSMHRYVAAVAVWLAVTFAAPALAFQCPADIGKIDAALAADATLSAEQRAEVETLRSEGEQLHQAGKHQEAVDALAKAKEILAIQ
ncbi:MAG: hypothetical protein ACREIB_05450, partial [Pseudomonadota bacterium]